jgi:spore coat polysaccharide biosynthesis protein SpsF (cytidylyltransferase family)
VNATKSIVVIQARTGSSRLPNKVLLPLSQGSVLDYVISRCLRSGKAKGVVVATTVTASDDPIVETAKRWGVPCFRGSEADVLDRYVRAGEAAGAEQVVRVTADCPLIDPAVIDEVITIFEQNPADYVYIEGMPNGLGAAELMPLATLQRVWTLTRPEDAHAREHVMTYITAHPDQFRLTIRACDPAVHRPDWRLCVDEAADLEVIRRIAAHFAPRTDFSGIEIVRFLDASPTILAINHGVRQRTS